jgi:arginine N-succinyltransferase
MKMLEGEGFKFANMVDIFEAGPVVTCARDEIRTVRTSIRTKIAEITDEPLNGEDWLISNARLDYRCCKGSLQTTPAGVRLSSATALALQVKVGDAVRYVTIRPPKIS